MPVKRLTRRGAITGLAISTGPLILGCRGKSGAAGREHAAATPVAAGSSAPTQHAPQHAPVLQRIESRSAIDGAGATVQRVFPGPQLRHLDPFVLLDDFNVREPAGFPEHPHRGFEAFTYMLEGAFHHEDNMGNDSVVTAGGTQRFNSGRYARHSEMPATKGANRGLQLWVNLPRVDKTMDPEYQGVQADAMPVDERDGLRLHTVVGESSPVALHTEVEYLDVTLLAGHPFAHRIPEGRNTLLYVIEDTVHIGDERVPRGSGVVLGPGDLEVRGEQGTRFAFLSGRPHNEPIKHKGPFVD